MSHACHHVQVGSKNAVFYMGGCVKVVTRRSEGSYVHELAIAAADLEERYRAHQASQCPVSKKWRDVCREPKESSSI